MRQAIVNKDLHDCIVFSIVNYNLFNHSFNALHDRPFGNSK